MKCVACGAKMKSKRENYRYEASGLSSVTLEGVEVARCPGCGETEVAIPAIEELHRVIAGALIRKRGRLAHAEIRFLRKYLGWSGADFARHMGTTPETVSRWEHGTTPMGGSADRLLRLLVATKAPMSDYRVDVLAEIGADDRRSRSRPVRLALSRDRQTGWRYRPDADLVRA